MNERTGRAFAGNDVHLVLAALEGILARGQRKLAFGPLAGMAFQTGPLENGLDIAGKINRLGSWRGQAGRVNRRHDMETKKSHAGKDNSSLHPPAPTHFMATMHSLQAELPSEIRRTF